MKGLACGALVILLWGGAVLAGSLETSLGAGFTSLALGDINASIGAVNRVLENWNTTPTLTGGVPVLGLMQVGMSYSAAERFWIWDSLAVGGKIESFHASSATQGSYTAGGTTSQISVALDCHSVGFVLGGHLEFASFEVDLGGDIGVGYYYSGFSTDVTFQTPSSVPPISIHPQEGKGRYTASSFGLEGGLSLTFHLTDWLGIGTSIAYRWAGPATMTDAAGKPLDIDGDGNADKVDLTGIVVQVTVSLVIDLSPPEGERRIP